MVGKLLLKTGETLQAGGMLYKSMLRLVLLYGSGSCVVMGAMLKVLEGFHHRLSRRILGMTAQCTMVGELQWPLVAEALDTSGLLTIKDYIHGRQDTVAAQVECCPIYDLFTGAERMTGTSKFMQ